MNKDETPCKSPLGPSSSGLGAETSLELLPHSAYLSIHRWFGNSHSNKHLTHLGVRQDRWA